jgi:hypothetical protein
MNPTNITSLAADRYGRVFPTSRLILRSFDAKL